MKRQVLLVVALGLLLPLNQAAAQRGARTDWNLKAPWGATRQDATRDPKTPYKIFDNVYYVGMQTVCSYLVTTNNGLVLIDASWAETADSILNNIRTLGFNPANIKYILVTHSHTDHLGGAAKVKEVSHAPVGMSAEDWTAAKMPPDLVLKDGQSLAVGDTTFKFYFTPGHTPGATSIEFQARDGGRTYRTLIPGGLGLQFGPAETPTFLKSMERLKQLGPWDAMLGNHPWLMPVYLGDVEKGLAGRGRGAHPAAPGAAKNNEWLDSVIKVTKDKLAAGQ